MDSDRDVKTIDIQTFMDKRCELLRLETKIADLEAELELMRRHLVVAMYAQGNFVCPMCLDTLDNCLACGVQASRLL